MDKFFPIFSAPCSKDCHHFPPSSSLLKKTLVFSVFPQSSEKTNQKEWKTELTFRYNIPVNYALNTYKPLSAHICHQLLALKKDCASSHLNFFQNISSNF